MNHEILSIPGNGAAYQRLLNLLRSGQAIAFVGAGASAGLYPLWEALLDELIDAVKGRQKITEEQVKRWRNDGKVKPLLIASRLRHELDGSFFDFLTRRFAPPATGPAFTETHSALAALPFRGFVTTNYDLGLTQAIAQQETFRAPATWKDPDVSRWLRDDHPGGGRPVLHAHGVYSDPASLVLDHERYGEVYDYPPFQELSRELWRGGRLVTVGFSFSDPWLGLIAGEAIRSSGQREGIAPGHVAVVGLKDLGEIDDRRFEIKRIYHGNVLVYPIVDGSHDALARLLDGVRHDLDPNENEGVIEFPVRPRIPDRWFELVAEDHRRLTDHFDRPVELLLLETAWVRLELSRSTPKRTDQGAEAEEAVLLEEVLQERSAPSRSTLDTYLALDRSKPENRWVTGRWLVEGDPGSGKTTLLRYLAARRAKVGDQNNAPLFLSLPKLTEPLRMPLDFVRDEVGGTCGVGLLEALASAGRDGRLLVLLDALDEVPPERRDRVGKILSWLAAEWPDATVVMSSRPIGRGAVPDDFVKLDLQPLDPMQRLEFLDKWFGSETTARDAAEHFDQEKSLRALSLNPLHLTLLAMLWKQGTKAPQRRSELYSEILAMLLSGKHREEAIAMEPIVATREILCGLAWAHTTDKNDIVSETPEQLADRLLDDDFDEPRVKVEKLWHTHRDFLDAVAERTYILGPHDGQQNPWRFWHRTLREALTAERLDQERESKGEEAILKRVEALDDEDEGRWAEPFALLAGRGESDRLIVELMRRRPSLGVRALETAQGLSAETLVEILGALTEPSQRGAVYEAIPVQLGDPDAALDLVARLRRQARGGNELYFLDLACRLTVERWPESKDRVNGLLSSLYDHIPAPPADLFRRFTTPKGETKGLWCTIPAGVYSIGSDDHHDNEKPRHLVEVVKPYAMSAVPVTNAQYAAFDPEKVPYPWSGVSKAELLDHPRITVTWWEAVSFCRWLASLGFEGARLPSEEEWEVACRAGTESEYWNGNGEEALDPIGWYDEDPVGDGRTHRVAGKLANPWGLYDVHGNIEEWTSTAWNSERYRDRSLTKPFAIDPAAELPNIADPRAVRTIRGGSGWATAAGVRSAFRIWRSPESVFDMVNVRGFRVMLPSTEPR